MASENSWAYGIETTIYSIIKSKTYSEIQKKYHNLLFTDKGQSDSPPTFPVKTLPKNVFVEVDAIAFKN